MAIPRIIHHIWIGATYPKYVPDYIDKWKKLYGEFCFLLWNDTLIRNSNILNRLPKWAFEPHWPAAFKADLLRFTLLKEIGGIYLDTDFEPLKRVNVDDLVSYEFVSSKQPNHQLATGFMAAEPNTPFITEVVKQLLNSAETSPKTNLTNGMLPEVSGPGWFTPVFRRLESQVRAKIFEPRFFYPYSWLEPERRWENFSLTCPDAYAVHHWEASWQKGVRHAVGA